MKPFDPEIIASIRNKLQTTGLISERVEAEEGIPESFIGTAIKDLKAAKKMLRTIKEETL